MKGGENMDKEVERIRWYVRKVKEASMMWGERGHRRRNRLLCYKEALNRWLTQ
jgi:hypothetical protein